jgi:hypothetical protein
MKHENEKVEIYLPQTLVTHEGSSAPREMASMLTYKCVSIKTPQLYLDVVAKSSKKDSHFTDTVCELLQTRVFPKRYKRKA